MPTTEADPRGLVLHTARLTIRPLELGDAPAMETLVGDWQVARYTARIPHPYPPGAAAASRRIGPG